MFGLGLPEMIIILFVTFLLFVFFKIFSNKRRKKFDNSRNKGAGMGKKKVKDYLNITEKTIKYSGQIYQLSNITQVTKYKITHKRGVKIILSLILGGVGGALATIPQDIRAIGFVLLPLAVIVFIWAIAKRSVYALVIETNAGSVEVLTSKDKHFINELIETISEVMERQIVGTNIAVNIKNRQFVDKYVGGDEVVGNKYSHIKDSSVGNSYRNSHNKNVSGDEVVGDKFGDITNSNVTNRPKNSTVTNAIEAKYGDDVSNAFEDIAQHINVLNDEGCQKLLVKIQEAMLEKKPDKFKISALWNSLVAILPDISKVAASIATVATAIL